jgi:hypothetical protein
MVKDTTDIKDEYKTRKDAVKEELKTDDSISQKASNIKEDLTSNSEELKMKQAEAGKFDSNDPHYFEKSGTSNEQSDSGLQWEGKKLSTGESYDDSSLGTRSEGKWEMYNPSKKELEEKNQLEESQKSEQKLGDWLQDTEEHAVIM